MDQATNEKALDPNLFAASIKETDAVWHSPRSLPFSVHGVYYDEEKGTYRRMPYEIAARVNPGVEYFSHHTSGGRVRFMTDSPYVALSVSTPHVGIFPNMSLITNGGVAVYAGGGYVGHVSPDPDTAYRSLHGGARFSGSVSVSHLGGELYECDLYLPLYGGVKELYVGIREGSRLLPPRPYARTRPLVFYGSSIFQGASASHPGNEFAAILSRRLDTDYMNFGCSGSGNAEQVMLDYIAAIDASAFIFDYNYAPHRPERVLPPHEEVYRHLRRAHPNTPILLMDKPSTVKSPAAYRARSAMIRATYEKALGEGDRLVRYLDSREIFGELELASFADDCHPNDLGFHLMANAMEPLLCEMLKEAEG